MNKQALSSLSVEQLRQCKQNLAKRIDDLKFFNLDLGRTNISLSEEYRELRQKADKVQKGKMPKLTKAKGYHKNIYLQHQSKPQQNNSQGTQISRQVNRNNFNFNDLYKLSKNKISSWIWQKPKKHQEIQLPNEHYHQNYSYNNQHYTQPQATYYQQVIVGDFPPAQVMKVDAKVQHDPLQQDVGFIVRHVPVIKIINNGEGQRDPIEQEITSIIKQPHVQQHKQQYQPHVQQNIEERQQGHYQRLYQPEQNARFIHEEQKTQIYQQQQYMLSQQHQIQQNQLPRDYQKPEEPQLSSQGKKATMKTFQFDDLPGLGWKKLKGLIGWGSKNKKDQQNKAYQAPPMHQQQGQYTNPQNQSNIPQVQGQKMNSNHLYQVQTTTLNSKHPVQRKRTPIFGSGINPNLRQSQQQQEDNSMKQARIQKQITRQEQVETNKQVNESVTHTNETQQLGVESRIEYISENQPSKTEKHDQSKTEKNDQSKTDHHDQSKAQNHHYSKTDNHDSI